MNITLKIFFENRIAAEGEIGRYWHWGMVPE